MSAPPSRSGRREAGSVGSLASLLAGHPVEIVFTGLVAAAFVWLLQATSETYFAIDDWALLRQGTSFRAMVEPYNDHLSVTILAVYRALIEVFGFAYTPFRVVGLVCLLAVPVAYFVTTRRLLGPPLAAIAALSMLGFANLEMYPAVMNHCLALVGGIGCAAALNRGRRADWVLAAALGFSLCAAGGGVAVAAACLTHNACTRPPLRRWLSVLGPCAIWGCWWLATAQDGGSQLRPVAQPTIAEVLRFACDVAWAPFDHLGGGNPLLAVALALSFAAYGLSRLRRGVAEAANFLAWSAAIAVWALGLAYGRGTPVSISPLQQTNGVFFRYQLLALGFALLAIVPRRPIRWPQRLQLATDPRWLSAAAVVILAITWVGGVAIRSDVESSTRWMEGYGRTTKGELLVLGLGRDVVPDDERPSEGLTFLGLRAGELRGLLDRYANSFGSTPATIDQRFVDLGVASAGYEPRSEPGCVPLTGPISWLPTTFGPLRLWSDRTAWTVEVRRFGTEWVPVAEARSDQAVVLRLPGLSIDEPWQVRAEGACQAARAGAP